MKNLKAIYDEIRPKVAERLAAFARLRESGTEEDIFIELCFCLLTPQSKARMAEKAIIRLLQDDALFHAGWEVLSARLNIIRFRNHKAQYIVLAREKCREPGGHGRYILRKTLESIPDVGEKRRWLVKNIKGLGIKEASHFLRNIGYGADLAILDRHVLRNLAAWKLIPQAPVSINWKTYLEYEELVRGVSKKTSIPMDYLDFVIWYKEARDIYK